MNTAHFRSVLLINLNVSNISTLQARLDRYNKLTNQKTDINWESLVNEGEALSSIKDYFPIDSMAVRNVTFDGEVRALEVFEEITAIVDYFTSS